MQLFYDTCALLNELHKAFETEVPFIISNITLKELEQIKTSNFKDSEIKFRARRLIHLLDANEDKYEVVNYCKAWDNELQNYEILSDNNDSRIILSAIKKSQESSIIFVTEDICCKKLAKNLGLQVKYLIEGEQKYCGYKEVIISSDEELADFYSKISYYKENPYKLLVNEYLIIKDAKGNIIDKYKYTVEGMKKIRFNCFESKMFGKIKPKDIYQQLVMDSMNTNKITMVRGAAGTGKSYLSFGFLFDKLENHEIEKIVIFCNTVATSGSAKLGYYPGSKDEKLLDSQIGNLLASKLGDKSEAERLITEGKIILLPMSDIRGYDTSGMKAGIYISEAQNLDIELMRLALQRIGEDSICILDGDSETQVDSSLYAGNNNGMKRVSEIFKGHDIYGEVTLKNIHRSQIAQLAQLM